MYALASTFNAGMKKFLIWFIPTMRARRLYMSTIILIAILRSPLVSNGNLSFNRGNEDCTALIPHSAHCRIEVHCCFRMMPSLWASNVAPSPTKLVCDYFIMYGALRIRKAESTAHIPPVKLYTRSNLIYISPQSAIVLSCVAPGRFMCAIGIVPSGQKQNTDVTKWLCFQPL